MTAEPDATSHAPARLDFPILPAQSVQSGELRMAYREQGQGPATVLLVHGSMCSSLWWGPVMARLPAHYRVLAPDLRGCGDTDKPDHGYHRAQYVEDLLRFLDAVDVTGPVSYAGHSLGGSIGFELALTAPSRVRCLTVIGNGAGPRPSFKSPARFEKVLSIRTEPTALRRFVAGGFGVVPEQPLLDLLVADTARSALGMWHGFAAGTSAPQLFLPDAVHAIVVPVTFCHGDRDRVVTRDWVLESCPLIPGARFVDFPGYGHNLHVEAPDRIAGIILEQTAGPS